MWLSGLPNVASVWYELDWSFLRITFLWTRFFLTRGVFSDSDAMQESRAGSAVIALENGIKGAGLVASSGYHCIGAGSDSYSSKLSHSWF